VTRPGSRNLNCRNLNRRNLNRRKPRVKVMGKGRSKEPEFVERQAAAANARKAMLEKFLAKAADPDAAARLQARAVEAAERDATRQAREKAKAEQKAWEAEAAAAAKREAAAQAERAAAEKAERQRAKEAEQKAARDARYAARKAKGNAGAKKGKR
jgi:Family of unknown function (DUF6481)